MNIAVNPRVVLRYLLGTIAALLLMDAALLTLKFGFAKESIYGVTYLFDVNTEQNIPTLFSTVDLLLAGGLLLLIFREARWHARRDANYWLGLACIFVFLAVDEFCSLHDRLNKPLHSLWHTTGALTYAWVIPYAGLVAIFALAYCRFWWRLPRSTRTLFAIAGVMYVGGAMGLELVGAELDSIFGIGHSLAAGIENLIEEGLEMAGVAVFVFGLLEILQTSTVTLRIGANIDSGLPKDELLSYVVTSDDAPGEHDISEVA